MSETDLLIQQLITGLSNGMIIALIAIGYTMVYGIIELINFAHGDLFTLGAFLCLTIIGALGIEAWSAGESAAGVAMLIGGSAVFCGGLNWGIDRLAYRPLRKAPKLALLVSAIGCSFVLINVALFWGGLPMEVFSGGVSAAAPKNVPDLVSTRSLLGEDSAILLTPRDVLVVAVTLPLLAVLAWLVWMTPLGRSMRAVAQDPTAAALCGINVDRTIGATFFVGGALAGVGSVVYALYNSTIHFQMGYRAGMDAFTAAVLGGIGSLPGAVLGGLVIGVVRAMSDQYVETRWTNAIVFAILILILVFRPSGILGAKLREKV